MTRLYAGVGLYYSYITITKIYLNAHIFINYILIISIANTVGRFRDTKTLFKIKKLFQKSHTFKSNCSVKYVMGISAVIQKPLLKLEENTVKCHLLCISLMYICTIQTYTLNMF